MIDTHTFDTPVGARRSVCCAARLLSAGVALVFALLAPAQAMAQAEPQLIGLLPSLIGGDAANDFNSAMVSQLSTYPGGSSAGGFTFTFNPTNQTFARNSDSFGPSFAERAMTMGQDTFNVGVTFQRATYDTFEGLNLSNGDVRFRAEGQPNPGDVVDARLAIDLSTDMMVFFMSYGLTDRLDVGTMVPIIRVGFDASITPTLVQTAAGPLPMGQRVSLPVQARSDTASGVGDVSVRTKYNFVKRPGGGASVMVDVRMPTGDAEEMLGTGAGAAKVMFVASSTLGRVAPHFNAGYTFVGARANNTIAIDDEWNYVAGVDTVVTNDVSASFDIVARTITNIGRLRLGPAPNQTGDPANQLNREAGNLNLRMAGVGLKWRVVGTWLVSGSVLMPLTDAGLVDHATWSLGLDWTK